MEDNKTAQTTEIENADAVEIEEGEIEKKGDGAADAVEEAKKPQSAEFNAEQARARRERERTAELKKAREDAILEALGGKNPFTGEDMKDSADIEEYLTQRKIQNDGGDPIADYAKAIKEKTRRAEEDSRKASEQNEWFRTDREAFVKAHPEVNISELLKDEDFNAFAEGKVGKKPLSAIYEGYKSLKDKYEEKAKAVAAQDAANAKATPGSLASTENGEGEYFTRDQVKAMTQEEVHKNWSKIEKSMKKWS